MIVVTGATGNVGAELAGGPEPVRALVRDPARAGLPAGVEAMRGDMTAPDSLAAAFEGARTLFLLPGYPGVAQVAAKAGVEHIVQLSGVSAGIGDVGNAVTRYMMASEREATECGAAWTILRPCAFDANALRWLPQLRTGDTVRVPFPTVRTASLDTFDLAAVAAAAFADPALRGEILWPTGPESLLPAEQIAVLADVLGRDLKCVGLSNDEAREDMLKTTPSEYVDAFFDFYVDGAIDESIVRPTVEQITGRAPRTFRQWAEIHAADFRQAGTDQ
ncbi:NAD(P)H-binding protein [Nocardia seriolae]|uniref:NAD(P)H dehydrogenase (Quinone) n=1 Tax=Nocardia seriolae TaxID=37332 RepID=A0A0B8NM90_9NOCA|nr:NAD(P)H-binding protein [Nocardia seriolae]APA98562.1 NAD(P)H dehydrogenase (quinone) [Nocardia seriolae]MTJ63649.1 NAD(P)H-binding protein [Nocardia seriolae]MTJ74335.1 NAD(P)H-binding protein [Nocardia seriolae]MTJ88220.1 NAD(P)H-binding protein [Nocardia seriolae]MTK32208.1 NAD(P)H-binding protein [Nocardia seriolae]